MAADLYAVLGVDADATAEELQAAYRKRVRLTHPDAGGDPVAFRAVNKAYEILSDPGLRMGYDAELAGPGVGQNQPGHPDPPPPPPGAAGSTTATGSGRRTSPSPTRVDVGQFSWAAPFLDLAVDHQQVRVAPGRRVVVRSWSVVGLGVVWFAVGMVAGWVRYDGSNPILMLWAFSWWCAVLVVGLRATQKRSSAVLLLAAGLAWPAYQHPSELYAWLVYAWLAGAVAVPILARCFVVEPGWSVRRVLQGNEWGEPAWDARESAEWIAQLAVIPGVRILHQAWGFDHVVVLDRKVAAVGDLHAAAVPGLPDWLQWRHWPRSIAADPQLAVDLMGEWLLAGTDGFTVDRLALRVVAPNLA